MATEILMPALSPTMTEGKLSRWVKHEGDTVTSGEVIAEIETDKATMEVEAVDEGVLGRILVQEGSEGVAVNTPIAILVAEGEAVPDASATPTAQTAHPAKAEASAQDSAPAPAPAAAPAPVAKPAPAPSPSAAGKPTRPFASPLARRIARDKGLDLSAVKGTGPNGRILRRDVQAALDAPRPAAGVASAATGEKQAGASTSVPLSTMRKVIARRLTEAKTTVPHFYVAMDIHLDALLALRTQLNAAAADGPEPFKLSVNDLLIKASALALRRLPEVNVSFAGDTVIQYEDIDISMAVAIPDGLITPIIRQADRKSLREIAAEAAELAKRAKAGKLKPEEFQGGTFSISNMGMFGVTAFSAIINPPQAAILAIAAGEKRPVVKGDTLAVGTVMTATLSADHRIIDGALAARWMAVFRSIVENPISLVL